MTHEQFIYWLKGYLTAQASSQMKIELEKAIKEVDETYAPSPIGVNPSTSPYSPTIVPGQPTIIPGHPFWYTTTESNGLQTTTNCTTKEVLNG
jgi:hypothetical protein